MRGMARARKRVARDMVGGCGGWQEATTGRGKGDGELSGSRRGEGVIT